MLDDDCDLLPSLIEGGYSLLSGCKSTDEALDRIAALLLEVDGLLEQQTRSYAHKEWIADREYNHNLHKDRQQYLKDKEELAFDKWLFHWQRILAPSEARLLFGIRFRDVAERAEDLLRRWSQPKLWALRDTDYGRTAIRGDEQVKVDVRELHEQRATGLQTRLRRCA
jgi:hypothetical protein